MLGIYIHVPFCAKKCPYCDFYSVPWRIALEEEYEKAVKRDLAKYKGLSADTLYFGGGTPSLIRPQTIASLIKAVKEQFILTEDAEITLECNPCTVTKDRAMLWTDAGINRVSLGMQSADNGELKLLGRKHAPDTVKTAVRLLKEAGIHNISLDLMLALPHQSMEMVKQSIAFAASLDVTHISAYMLQIEPGTPFAESEEIRFCPDEEQTADIYLQTVDLLAQYGFAQYEISNFAKPGHQSRHNNKYWEYEPYLGFGPAAHSFYDGKRFSYPPDLTRYCKEGRIEVEQSESDADEFAMLQLRLTKGLRFADYKARGGDDTALKARCQKYQNTGLIELSDQKINLTPKGFLISNALIAALLF